MGRDLRGWIAQLEAEGELRRIQVPVDPNGELAAICRTVLDKQGPALLFENIKGHTEGTFTKLFTGGMGSFRRSALMLNLPKDAPRRRMMEKFRACVKQPLPAVTVETGPVKENILTGDAIDLNQLPVPLWHPLDGGKYINTWCTVITRDPETGEHNLGAYRGMIVGRDQIGVLLLMSQHWGHHFAKYQAMGKPMPVSVVYGWDPALAFVSGAQIPPGDDWGIVGAIRGEAVELVKSQTSDVMVPASAEIVVEGFIDGVTVAEEGPFGEFTGIYGGDRRKRHVLQVTAVTHRNDPIYRGSLEGAGPKQLNEDSFCYAISTRAAAFDVLERAGVPGIVDVRSGSVTYVKIKKSYEGQAKQVAAALWGSYAAEYLWKVVMVVDEDVDIYDERHIQWAMCYRVNPGSADLVVFPDTRGGSLDPTTAEKDRDEMVRGTGRWDRLLIDATESLASLPRDAMGRPTRRPLSTEPAPEDVARVQSRWAEYGID